MKKSVKNEAVRMANATTSKDKCKSSALESGSLLNKYNTNQAEKSSINKEYRPLASEVQGYIAGGISIKTMLEVFEIEKRRAFKGD